MRFLVLLLLFPLLIACNSPKSPVKPMTDNTKTERKMKQQQVFDALTRLCRRHNSDAFVIFADAKSEKYVQFAGDRGKLILDLPSQTLNTSEMDRAKSYFEKLGENLKEDKLYTEPGGIPAGTMHKFSMELGNDVERATSITIDAFFTIYQFPPEFELKISEN